MSFKRGLSKPTKASPPKQNTGSGKGISISSFSFKQLEEDEDDEDLTLFTGKYDKVVEESQKSKSKRPAERTSSTSSVSSTSSAVAESKPPIEKTESGTDVVDADMPSLKKTGSLTINMENTNSPIKERAKAKLESSKELFSGLKGKITDKISRTIEEFSSDSSLSPEKEVVVADMTVANGKDDLIVKETVALFKSSGVVEDHPLSHLEKEDSFEDVIELCSGQERESSNEDDTLIFHDPQEQSGGDGMLVFEEHFTETSNEPVEDFTSMPGLSTSTQLRPRSKIKRLMKKKEPRTSAVAHMAALRFSPDEELVTDSTPQKYSSKDNEKSKDLTDSAPTTHQKTVPSEPVKHVFLRQLSIDSGSVPLHKMVAVIVVVFLYLIVPLPSYLSGFVMGALLTAATWAVYMWLMQPPPPEEPFVLPPLEASTPPPVPEMKTTVSADEYSYKGWMNELTDYNPEDYHINKTHSVYISLEGTHLRLQRPKNPVPKRAMWDESIPKPQYIHQRHFNLVGASVFLEPQGLVKKRIWSKKYPICITLPLGEKKNEDATNKLKHTYSEPVIASSKREKLTDMGFEIVSEDKCEHNTLYLFARTGREKEEWFRRFAAAASNKPKGNHILEMKRVINQSSQKPILKHRRQDSTDSVKSSSSLPEGSVSALSTSAPSSPEHTEPEEDTQEVDLLTFAHYMGRLMPSGLSSRVTSPVQTKDIPKEAKDVSGATNKEADDTKSVLRPNGVIICDSQLFWVNALIGRCFFDFLRDKWWIGKVTEKLQRKLSKIHVPYFIEELQVTDIHMGYEIPAVRNAGKPYMDERGFWIDLDITYSGGFKMTIETKMNLMKLKKSPHASASSGHSVDSAKSPITDSDEEDSAESSTDEEEEAPNSSEDGASGGGGKKFMRYLNKITQSKYFQQATEYKVIKRAMENVSNTPLTLTVTVNSLVGKLAINIPPPPSDRLWYGFRGNPRLRLSAKPQVGERAVTITHVTEWIEKKLAVEFQRVFVMPNMDDLVIPILVPGEVSGVTITHSVSL